MKLPGVKKFSDLLECMDSYRVTIYFDSIRTWYSVPILYRLYHRRGAQLFNRNSVPIRYYKRCCFLTMKQLHFVTPVAGNGAQIPQPLEGFSQEQFVVVQALESISIDPTFG